VFRVEAPLGVEILDAEAVVPEFVHGCGPLCESLVLSNTRLIGFIVVDEWRGMRAFGGRNWRLAVDEIYGKTFWVDYREAFASTRSVCKICDGAGAGNLGCSGSSLISVLFHLTWMMSDGGGLELASGV